MQKIGNFNIRTDLWYDTDNGFWLDIVGKTARVGMNPLVQETSGSFVSIHIQDIGKELESGQSFGSVEAEKHVGHLKAPVSGKVIAVNPKVLENPRLINTDPYGKGWLVEIEMSSPETEKNSLLSGHSEVTAWFETEIKKYEEKGWLAEAVEEIGNIPK